MRKFCKKVMRKFREKKAWISWKNAKISRKKLEIMRKKRMFGEKCRIFKKKCKVQTFIKVKEEKLFIWHNKTSTMSYHQSMRIPQALLCLINCCLYKTHGFHKIFAFRIFTSFIFAKKCEISRKSLWNATENIFSRNVLFDGNPRSK